MSNTCACFCAAARLHVLHGAQHAQRRCNLPRDFVRSLSHLAQAVAAPHSERCGHVLDVLLFVCRLQQHSAMHYFMMSSLMMNPSLEPTTPAQVTKPQSAKCMKPTFGWKCEMRSLLSSRGGPSIISSGIATHHTRVYRSTALHDFIASNLQHPNLPIATP